MEKPKHQMHSLSEAQGQHQLGTGDPSLSLLLAIKAFSCLFLHLSSSQIASDKAVP